MKIDIYAETFWQFRKILRTLYKMGYFFDSRKKYTSIGLWIGYSAGYPVNGISFNIDSHKMKYFNYSNFTSKELNILSYKEFLKKDMEYFNEL